MPRFTFINGERYELTDTHEAKKANFNSQIINELNKITGMCTNEEKTIKKF